MGDCRLEASTCDGLLSAVKTEYGINARKIAAVCDEEFTIYSHKNGLCLQKTNDSESFVIFMTGLYEYVKNRGFNNLLKLYRAKSGRYYIRRPDGIYLLYDYMDMKSSGFSFSKNGSHMMRLLYDFSTAAQGYIPPSGGKGKSCFGIWAEQYKKELLSLKKCRDRLKESSSLSPFEIMFLSDCDLFMQRIEESIMLLNRNDYLKRVEDSMQKHQVCISSFKQSNFFNNKGEMNIKTLKKCRYDILEKDIAELAAKFQESCIDSRTPEIVNLLQGYSDDFKLNDNSMKLIKAFMLFPDEYVKVYSKYFKNYEKCSYGEYMDKLRSAANKDNIRAKLAYML